MAAIRLSGGFLQPSALLLKPALRGFASSKRSAHCASCDRLMPHRQVGTRPRIENQCPSSLPLSYTRLSHYHAENNRHSNSLDNEVSHLSQAHVSHQLCMQPDWIAQLILGYRNEAAEWHDKKQYESDERCQKRGLTIAHPHLSSPRACSCHPADLGTITTDRAILSRLQLDNADPRDPAMIRSKNIPITMACQPPR